MKATLILLMSIIINICILFYVLPCAWMQLLSVFALYIGYVVYFYFHRDKLEQIINFVFK